jgi:hypothetical protein
MIYCLDHQLACIQVKFFRMVFEVFTYNSAILFESGTLRSAQPTSSLNRTISHTIHIGNATTIFITWSVVTDAASAPR